MAFKVIIAGSRQFNDYNFLKQKCDNALKNIKDEIIIISGCAKGADALGERYAQEKGYYLMECPAKWEDIEGKPLKEIKTRNDDNPYWVKAGYHRNSIMVDEADALIAFDMGTNGIRDTIEKANKKGIKIKVYEY